MVCDGADWRDRLVLATDGVERRSERSSLPPHDARIGRLKLTKFHANSMSISLEHIRFFRIRPRRIG